MLEAVEDCDVELFPHCRHPVPRVWGAGRSTLVGDAAHTVSPSQAQGANQALEDAWALGHSLRSPGDIPARLRRYERARSRRAALIARVAGSEATVAYRPTRSRLTPDAVVSVFYTHWLKRISNYLAGATP